jgi:hypothetical protein
MNSSRLLVLTICLQLCGCDYVVREVQNVQCSLPYQLRDVVLRVDRDHLEFGVTDLVRDLRGATIIPETLRLKDVTGKECRISLSNGTPVYNGTSPFEPSKGKVERIRFKLNLERQKNSNHALSQGDYTLQLSLLHQGAVYPLVCHFSLVDRTKPFRVSKI